jgi:capsular exopolysaccharide synthesis family protein
MSRIHEALKKAEEERAKHPLPPPPSNAAEISPAGTAPEEEVLARTAQESLAAAQPELDERGDRLTVEVLRTQVRRYTWHANPRTMLFFDHEAYAPGTEEFRTLRSRLYGMRELQPLRTILMTSASPREGKSFIAANLAQIFSQQSERRVLLIDGDLRWSRLHLSLGTPSTPGLTEYLRGEADELAVLQRGPLENLFFIPGGKHASHPAELISNGRFENLLRSLSPLFDWLVVDSPPAMAVSDARVLGSLCDGVLLVVAAGMSPYDVAQKARQQFDTKRLLGVVLNRAEPRMTYSYKYYGYYQGSAKNGNGKARG